MRFLTLACVLLAGCDVHHEELAAVQAQLNQQLAGKQEIAQNLNERRREMDELERRLAAALAELPGVDAGVVVLAPAPTVMPPMPRESPLEGSGARRQRVQIDDTRRRITELEKVLGEVNGIDVRKREIEAKLKRLEQIRRERGGDTAR